MAKIPLPERGQPIDLSYIYEITSAVNDLSSQMTNSAYRYVTIDTPNAGPQTTMITDTKIIGGYVEVVSGADLTAGNEKTFSYTFPTDFKYPPIAVATPINVGNTEAGRNVSVVLKSVANGRIDGYVRFNSSGNVGIGISIIAIGIPN